MADKQAEDQIIPRTPTTEEYSTSTEFFDVAEDQGEVFISDDPVELFINWFQLAKQHEMNDANAIRNAFHFVDQVR